MRLLSDDRARPLHWLTSPGQRGDSPMFAPVLNGLRIRHRGPGRPRSRPDRVRGDKAYSSRDNRDYLRRRGIKATIAQPDDQRAHRKRRGRSGGRPPAFDKTQYCRRNAVERCVNKWKQFRAVATRYDKRDYIFNGTTKPRLVLDASAQDLLFRQARTADRFTSEPVPDDTIRAVYDLVRFGPTAVNQQPLRILLLRSQESRTRLAVHLSRSNREKTLRAPLTALLAVDNEFHGKLSRLFPTFPGAADL